MKKLLLIIGFIFIILIAIILLYIRKEGFKYSIINSKPKINEPLKLEKIPKKIALLAFKSEKKMELWGLYKDKWDYIKTYKILGASGKLGPKLKEGDCQVPEGIYKIIGMNPKSKYYYAMLIDYPNEFDKKKAAEVNRTNLGGDICIHGTNLSVGCIAIGDYSKELYDLVEQVKLNNTKVIISPYDFRNQEELSIDSEIDFIPELYEKIKKELGDFHK
ncbi:MAG: L,D-transpeptidase family protein [Clostridiales bacterium]